MQMRKQIPFLASIATLFLARDFFAYFNFFYFVIYDNKIARAVTTGIINSYFLSQTFSGIMKCIK